MSESKQIEKMSLHLDKFQLDKRARMKILLNEIEQKKQLTISEFFSYVAIMYGIRKPTAEEYLEAWIDGGYITIERDVIRFLKKPEYQ